MSNGDELLTDVRQARRDLDGALLRMGDCAVDPEDTLREVAGHAGRLSGLIGQLDDHMSVSATPPADWPAPVAVPALALVERARSFRDQAAGLRRLAGQRADTASKLRRARADQLDDDANALAPEGDQGHARS